MATIISCHTCAIHGKILDGFFLPRETDVGLDGPSAHDVGREGLREEGAPACPAVLVAERRMREEQGGQEAQPGAAGPHLA